MIHILSVGLNLAYLFAYFKNDFWLQFEISNINRDDENKMLWLVLGLKWALRIFFMNLLFS